MEVYFFFPCTGRERLCRFARTTEAFVIGCIARNINRKQNRSYRLKHQKERRNENKLDSFSMRYRYNSGWQRRVPLSTLLYPPTHFSVFLLAEVPALLCPQWSTYAKMCATVELRPSLIVTCLILYHGVTSFYVGRRKFYIYHVHNDFPVYEKDAPRRNI